MNEKCMLLSTHTDGDTVASRSFIQRSLKVTGNQSSALHYIGKVLDLSNSAILHSISKKFGVMEERDKSLTDKKNR